MTNLITQPYTGVEFSVVSLCCTISIKHLSLYPRRAKGVRTKRVDFHMHGAHTGQLASGSRAASRELVVWNTLGQLVGTGGVVELFYSFEIIFEHVSALHPQTLKPTP